jgi:hypothetical protein
MNAQQDNVAAKSAKIVALNPSPDTFSIGEPVYLDSEYYTHANTTVLEVPRYGWQVKGIVNDMVCIEYMRKNLKLLMTLTVEAGFIKREL